MQNVILGFVLLLMGIPAVASMGPAEALLKRNYEKMIGEKIKSKKVSIYQKTIKDLRKTKPKSFGHDMKVWESFARISDLLDPKNCTKSKLSIKRDFFPTSTSSSVPNYVLPGLAYLDALCGYTDE